MESDSESSGVLLQILRPSIFGEMMITPKVEKGGVSPQHSRPMPAAPVASLAPMAEGLEVL